MERWRPRSLRTWDPTEEMEHFFEDPLFGQLAIPQRGLGKKPP